MRHRWLFALIPLVFMGYVLPRVLNLLTYLLFQPSPIKYLSLLIFPAYLIAAATLSVYIITSWLEIE